MTLRANLIHLAHANPNLRADLLPLIKEASSLSARDEAVIGSWWSYQSRKGDLLMSDGTSLWLVAEGAKIPVAAWTGRFKYTFAPGGFRLLDMVQDAVREWESYHPMVRQRIRNSPITMMDARLASDKKAFSGLTTRDEMVIRRWWSRKPMAGDILFSDGETLSGIWGEVPTTLAVWMGWGTFKMIPTTEPKKKMVQSEVRRLAPGGSFSGVPEGMLENAVRLAAKAPKPAPKLKGKKLDDAISKAYYRHGEGVQVNMMDISKIYDAGKKAYEGAATVEEADAALDEAMKAAITKFRMN
jgi:hypothetical protein